MASLIDPITGLPLDFRVPDQYQIPLNSQPVLAPEWDPQGRINTTLFPDNIPSVFATAQAQNEIHPQTVQALTTDGQGNLNVNIKAGGGGGGGGGGMSCSTSQLFVGGGEIQPQFTGAGGYQPLVWDITNTNGPYLLDPTDQSKIQITMGGLLTVRGQFLIKPNVPAGFPTHSSVEVDLFVNGAAPGLVFGTLPIMLPLVPTDDFIGITLPFFAAAPVAAGDVIQIQISTVANFFIDGVYTYMVASLL